MFNDYASILRIESRMNLEDIEKSKRVPPPAPPPPPPRNIKGRRDDLGDYEESERIASRMEAIFNIAFGYEIGSWLTRFRIVRKMKGGRWELWRCPWIDQERWVRVDDHKLESTGAPDGITIQYVEIHRR